MNGGTHFASGECVFHSIKSLNKEGIYLFIYFSSVLAKIKHTCNTFYVDHSSGSRRVNRKEI